MKVIIALACLASVAFAASVSGSDKDATVVKSEFDNIGVEGYKFGYETSNGISANEAGELVNAGSETEHHNVRGSYSYTGADGVKYLINYVADENGFQPEGEHLPKP